MADRPTVVRNAADPRQVRLGRRKDQGVERRRAEVLLTVLSTYEGREFVWSELARHMLFDSITRQSSEIYTLSGRRDAGLELLAEIMRWAPDQYVQMQTENNAREASSARETEAAHTPPAEAGSALT